MDKKMIGGGAVIVAILMALTVPMGWSGNLHYLWALLVLIWGLMALKGK